MRGLLIFLSASQKSAAFSSYRDRPLLHDLYLVGNKFHNLRQLEHATGSALQKNVNIGLSVNLSPNIGNRADDGLC